MVTWFFLPFTQFAVNVILNFSTVETEITGAEINSVAKALFSENFRLE